MKPILFIPFILSTICACKPVAKPVAVPTVQQSAAIQAAPPEAAPSVVKWEYRTDVITNIASIIDATIDNQLEAAMLHNGPMPDDAARTLWRLKPGFFTLATNLAAAGAEGWELVSAVPTTETIWSAVPGQPVKDATPNTRTREIILLYKRPMK